MADIEVGGGGGGMREAWGDRSSNFRSQSNPPIRDWSVRGVVFSQDE